MMYLPTFARSTKDAKLAVKPDKITEAILKLNWVPFYPIAGIVSFKIHSNMKLYNKFNGRKKVSTPNGTFNTCNFFKIYTLLSKWRV